MVDPGEKEKIGIIRALDVRINHAEFAKEFKNFQPIFIANQSNEIKEYIKQKHILNVDLKLSPKFIYDPIFPLLKKTDFTPWLEFEQDTLESVTNDVKVFEVYEPYFFYSSQIADLAKKKNIPLVTEIWTSFANHPAKYIPPYSSVIKNVISKTDLFILRSERAQNYLKSFNIPKMKQAIIYHGVNVKRFYPSKKNKDIITILFVGALAEHKGLDDLLAIFPDLVRKYPNRLQLIICGEGPMKKNVIRVAELLPIDFRGKVANNVLHKVYQESDIYCQPSKDYYFLGIKGGEEFAGYTFMESLASGLPIVSARCGGIPEIVGNKNSLIDQGNREQLFFALDRYIGSAQLRDEVGIKNRKRAESLFDLSKQVEKIEKNIKSKFF